jgi:hypothetical protein
VSVPVSRLRRAAAVVGLTGVALAHAGDAPALPQVAVRIDDIDRFYRVHDAAHGTPTVEDLQSNYFKSGSSRRSRIC